MSAADPFSEPPSVRERDFVAIDRNASLQAVESGRPGIYVGHPSPVIINVSGVASTADGRAPAITHAHAVAQTCSSRRNISLREKSDEMDRNEGSTELYHFRSADRGLQPGAMMEGSVPVTDWRMKAPERDLEIVIVAVSDERSLHFHSIAGGLCGKADFAEIADLPRQRRREVQIQLAEIKPTVHALLVGCGKIDVAKSPYLQ